jgi:hypothetical protein
MDWPGCDERSIETMIYLAPVRSNVMDRERTQYADILTLTLVLVL